MSKKPSKKVETKKLKFKVGQVVNVTIPGKIYSVNNEGGENFYGVEWVNSRGLTVKTLHDETFIKG